MSLADVFLRPDAWPVLLFGPAVGVALRSRARVRERELAAIVGARAGHLAGRVTRPWVRPAAVAAALVLAALAWMQPVWGEGPQKLTQRGVDLVVCLDVSKSMLARDQAPDRLGAAKAEIRALAERAKGDRIALVVFAGEARLVVPLTRDLDSLVQMADLADPLSVERGGTDLGAAVLAALAALDGSSGLHEAVVVLTDGEDAAGRGAAAAGLCRERGIAVHCVGFGSPRGAKIAVETALGETFLRDRAGRDVVTSMDAASLRRIAETAGGAFVEAAATPSPVVSLYDDRITSMARKAFAEEERRERTQRFQWPLLGAFGLFLCGTCFGGRRFA